MKKLKRHISRRAFLKNTGLGIIAGAYGFSAGDTHSSSYDGIDLVESSARERLFKKNRIEEEARLFVEKYTWDDDGSAHMVRNFIVTAHPHISKRVIHTLGNIFDKYLAEGGQSISITVAEELIIELHMKKFSPEFGPWISRTLQSYRSEGQ